MSVKQISLILYNELKLSPNLNIDEYIQDHFKKNFSTELFFDESIIEAFIHKSFTHENKLARPHNERLEFLGDSVLQLIVSQMLYTKFLEMNEGKLSKLRSSLVNEQALSKLATVLGLGSFILMGKGEAKEKGHEKSSLLANTFEAYLGALYRSKNLEFCFQFLENVFDTYESTVGEKFLSSQRLDSFDYKTKLQELVMKKYQKSPDYQSKLVKQGGKEAFEVSLFIDDKLIKTTTHISKKKAIKNLAKDVFENKLI